MKFRIILLLSLIVSCAETEAQEFVCGFESDETSGASNTSASSYASGTHQMLILFGRFSGDTATPPNLSKLKGRDGKFNQSANDLLKLSKPGSLAHFFKEMSFGHLTLTSVPDNPTTPQAENEPFWVNSNQAVSPITSLFQRV